MVAVHEMKPYKKGRDSELTSVALYEIFWLCSHNSGGVNAEIWIDGFCRNLVLLGFGFVYKIMLVVKRVQGDRIV